MISPQRRFFLNSYYRIRPLIPRTVQRNVRRAWVAYLRTRYQRIWPVNPAAAENKPQWWRGWPDGKRFALVLTHDVDTAEGQRRCRALMDLEERIGVRSMFNIVPEEYPLDLPLLDEIKRRGFELGVHGLSHDGLLFESLKTFKRRAAAINGYIHKWNASGFRAPSMHHNLEWIGELDIEYDLSTFDSDPFEPQSDAVTTIYPFYVGPAASRKGYIEIPYTLPQDFTLFVLMGERTDAIWRKKIDWLARSGGWVLMLTHPDYMHFGADAPGTEEFSVSIYKNFLEYVLNRYEGQFWSAVPREINAYCRASMQKNGAGP